MARERCSVNSELANKQAMPHQAQNKPVPSKSLSSIFRLNDLVTEHKRLYAAKRRLGSEVPRFNKACKTQHDLNIN